MYILDPIVSYHVISTHQRTMTIHTGKLPSDELVKEVLSFLQLPSSAQITIPTDARQALEALKGASIFKGSASIILPLLTNSVEILEQIPLLIEEVADGARDFIPPPASVKAAVRKAYRARRTLILEYDNDSIDESGDIEELLREAERIIRMKRPMVTIDLQRRKLEGNHATPLLAPPMDLATRVEDILGEESSKQRLFYEQADKTVDELVDWLEEANL